MLSYHCELFERLSCWSEINHEVDLLYVPLNKALLIIVAIGTQWLIKTTEQALIVLLIQCLSTPRTI